MRDFYKVNLTSEEKQMYIFSFKTLEERFSRLQWELDYTEKHAQGIRDSLDQLWAEMNELKSKLEIKGKRT